MAKKKTVKKPAPRRRRIGAAKMSPDNKLVKLGSALAGFAMADKVNAQIDKLIPANVDAKIVGVGQAGLGALLLMPKAPNNALGWVKVVGGGLVGGAGVKRALKAFNIIGGYGQVPVIAGRVKRSMNGYGAVPVIGSYEAPGTLGSYEAPGTLGGDSTKVMGSVYRADAASAGMTQ